MINNPNKIIGNILGGMPKKDMASFNNSDGEYTVMNMTDGIPAAPNTFGTISQAKNFIKQFVKRYKKQGYYKTSDGRRIDPEFVELQIYDDNNNVVFNNNYDF